MTTKAADDFEAIRRRLEELKAEKMEALTGSSAPQGLTQGSTSHEGLNTGHIESVYGIDYSAWRKDYGLSSAAHPEWPYAGTGFEWRRFVRS